FVEECDQIIVAIGQRLDIKKVFGNLDIHLSPNGFVKVNPLTGQTNILWIFSGGDASAGPASVVTAVGEGEKAAAGIDFLFTGEDHAFWREDQAVQTEYDPDADPVPYPREKIPVISVDRRISNFDEVEQPWLESAAIRQCSRCLRCDYGKTPVRKEVILHA
ncbi:MAG: hydrogenase, partial [Spirochaetales bacterium]